MSAPVYTNTSVFTNERSVTPTGPYLSASIHTSIHPFIRSFVRLMLQLIVVGASLGDCMQEQDWSSHFGSRDQRPGNID
jgi:hypothetical protein